MLVFAASFQTGSSATPVQLIQASSTSRNTPEGEYLPPSKTATLDVSTGGRNGEFRHRGQHQLAPACATAQGRRPTVGHEVARHPSG
jgi:hypothetical protein